MGFDLAHGIDQLAAHQVKRRLEIDLRVVEWVGDDLWSATPARFAHPSSRTSARCGQQRADADDEPNLADVAHEFRTAGMRREQPKHVGSSHSNAGDTAQMACRITCGAGYTPP